MNKFILLLLVTLPLSSNCFAEDYVCKKITDVSIFENNNAEKNILDDEIYKLKIIENKNKIFFYGLNPPLSKAEYTIFKNINRDTLYASTVIDDFLAKYLIHSNIAFSKSNLFLLLTASNIFNESKYRIQNIIFRCFKDR